MTVAGILPIYNRVKKINGKDYEMLYAEKKIMSGPLLEVYNYPIFKNGRAIPTGKKKGTSKAQEVYNYKKSTNELVRIVNANFEKGDLFVTASISPENAPETEEEARNIVRKYIRAIRKYRRDNGIGDFRCVYTIQAVPYKSGKYIGKMNLHFHMFITKMDRDVVEDMWQNFGKFEVNASRFQPDTFGPERAAKYMAKDESRLGKHKKSFVCTRNCKKPVELPKKEKNIGKKKIVNMCTTYCHDSAYWERQYPGYKFLYCTPKFNEYNGCWYWRAVFRLTEKYKTKKLIKSLGGGSNGTQN